MQEEKYIEDFFKRNNNLKRERFSVEYSKKGNIIIFNKKDPRTNYVISKKTGQCIGRDITFTQNGQKVTQKDAQYAEILRTMRKIEGFKEDDYHIYKSKNSVRFEKKARDGHYSYDTILIRLSDSFICEWKSELPRPSFSNAVINKIENEIKENFSKSKKIRITDIKITEDKDDKLKANISFYQENSSQPFAESFITRDYLIDSNETADIEMVKRNIHFMMSKSNQEKIFKSINNKYLEVIEKFGGRTEFCNFTNGKVVQLFFPDIRLGWLYNWKPKNKNVINYSKDYLDGGKYIPVVFDDFTAKYDERTGKIIGNIGDSGKADNYYLVFDNLELFKEAVKLCKKYLKTTKFKISTSSIRINTSTDGHKHEYIIDTSNSNWKKLLLEVASEINNKNIQYEEKEEKEIRERPYFGDILPYEIVKFVYQNTYNTTPRNIANMLKGRKVTIESIGVVISRNEKRNANLIKLTENAGKFYKIHEFEITDIIEELIEDEIIGEKQVRGTFGNYRVIIPDKKTRLFLECCENERASSAKSFTGKSELSVIKRIDKIIKDNENVSENEMEIIPSVIGKNFLYALEHPAVFQARSDYFTKYCLPYVDEKYVSYARAAILLGEEIGNKESDFIFTETKLAKQRYKKAHKQRKKSL